MVGRDGGGRPGRNVNTRQPDRTVSVSTGRAAFPRAARLTRPSEFKRIFDKPVVSADAFFRVLARAGTGTGPRLGMAVSRNVERRAAGRNRIKRIVRESFRRYFGAESPGGCPVDVIVLPRQLCARTDNRQLSESLQRHWVRIVARVADAGTAADTE